MVAALFTTPWAMSWRHCLCSVRENLSRGGTRTCAALDKEEFAPGLGEFSADEAEAATGIAHQQVGRGKKNADQRSFLRAEKHAQILACFLKRPGPVRMGVTFSRGDR